MTIYDLRNIITVSDKVEIIDTERLETVFEGTYGNVPIAYADCDVHRISSGNEVIGITINTWDEL